MARRSASSIWSWPCARLVVGQAGTARIQAADDDVFFRPRAAVGSRPLRSARAWFWKAAENESVGERGLVMPSNRFAVVACLRRAGTFGVQHLAALDLLAGDVAGLARFSTTRGAASGAR